MSQNDLLTCLEPRSSLNSCLFSQSQKEKKNKIKQNKTAAWNKAGNPNSNQNHHGNTIGSELTRCKL